MANYPSGTVKAVVSGSLPNGEQFAFGWQMQGDAGMGQLALTNLLGVCVGAVQSNLLTATVLGYFPTGVAFKTITLYLYDGSSVAKQTAQAAITARVGTGTNPPLPDQIGVVASLLTGLPGRSYRGRLYLPMLTSSQLVAGTGQIPPGVCTDLANALGSMFSAIKNSSNGKPPVVASATKGAMTPITQVAVDSLYDTQRRRRNKATASTRATASTA